MRRNIKREALPTCVSLSVRLSIIITNIVLKIIIKIVANIIAMLITFTILLWVPHLLWCGPSLVAASVAFQNCLKCIFVSTSITFSSVKNCICLQIDWALYCWLRRVHSKWDVLVFLSGTVVTSSNKTIIAVSAVVILCLDSLPNRALTFSWAVALFCTTFKETSIYWHILEEN